MNEARDGRMGIGICGVWREDEALCILNLDDNLSVALNFLLYCDAGAVNMAEDL